MGIFEWVRRARSAAGGSPDPGPGRGTVDAAGRPSGTPPGPSSGPVPGRAPERTPGRTTDQVPTKVPAARPLPRPAGDDTRTAGSGTVAQVPADVPTPLSRRRLTDWFAAQGYSWFVDGDGDVGGLWRGRPFWFLCLGSHAEILQVRGQWHRDIAIERLTEVLEVCNEWNTDRLWPKAYVRVRDDGTVHVTCEVATDLEHGVTDDQLSDLVHCGISSALTLFDELDARYPDPVSRAP